MCKTNHSLAKPCGSLAAARATTAARTTTDQATNNQGVFGEIAPRRRQE